MKIYLTTKYVKEEKKELPPKTERKLTTFVKALLTTDHINYYDY